MKNIEAEFTYKQLKEMRDKPIKQLARKKVSGRMVNQIGYVVTIVIRSDLQLRLLEFFPNHLGD